MKFNTTLDLVAIAIIAFSIFCLSGCSMFKPGTLERMEVIAIEDELKLGEDEIKELEGDIQKPTKKVQHNGRLKNH
jgi:hypothetical protein